VADPGNKPASTGLLPIASELIGLQRKLRQLKGAEAATSKLSSEVGTHRAPLLQDLRTTLQRGDQLAEAADTADSAALPQRARDIDELTAHFRKVSAALVPLGKMGIVLDSHRANLDEWRNAVDSSYDTVLRTFLLHLGLLVIAIVAILGASDFWRRATFKYFRDVRRRQQSLVVRRIVVAVALLLVITFSLVTEFGSIATFAGFITAGLAVALQNVILSVAAYFFLVGRYGIRVGDRVQIGGVTGDVMDVGLVRMHLMEVEGDGLPTGRVTVFSNSVLFQPSANFFKQMPGSNFAWHHVAMTLSPQTDYRYAEKRLLDAVSQVYAEYQGRIVREHEEISENLARAMHHPVPQSTLRLTDGGLEMTIRYPVLLETASATDDKVTRALLDALEREPRLRLVGSPSATIQPSPEPPAHPPH
jgi:small-conductance mechanosensitive channel